ncbi:MAG: N-6 DNA methylase [Pseudomonadota bacterium]|nr:N-6 DNA methylase [Pseudomonadota bacterium]
MGRHSKKVVTSCGNNRRESGYYSTPNFIAEFLTRKSLELLPNGKQVIDPCVGKEELISAFYAAGKKITGIDIHDYNVHKKAYFIQKDFIDIYSNYKNINLLNSNEFLVAEYDYWIANPPYNCHEIDYIQTNKHKLKALFSDVGVHNMYALFISAIIDMTRVGAIIALITFDSFLTSKAHKKLRQKILNNTSLHYLILCPTDLFWAQKADVRTCMLILQKGTAFQSTVNISNRPKNTEALKNILINDDFDKTERVDIILDSYMDSQEWIIGVPGEIRALFRDDNRIGNTFKCITGISTGNDKKYLSPIKDPSHTIPFYKNPGSRKFFSKEDSYLVNNFLDIEKSVRSFIVRNKALLYKAGISCSSMGIEFSACYLPPKSTYGVNPNIICEEADIWWLMAYLNSDLVSYMVRGVLIRTNMITSGYASRIPIAAFSKQCKQELEALAKKAYEFSKRTMRKPEQELNEINIKIYECLNMSQETRQFLVQFKHDILRLT